MVCREAEIIEDNSDFTHPRLHRTGGCASWRVHNIMRVSITYQL